MHTVKSRGAQPVVIRSIPFQIEEKRVLRELRIPRLKYVKELEEEGVARSIKRAIDRAYTMIRGQGCYRTLRIKDARPDRVTTQESDGLFIGSNMVNDLGNFPTKSSKIQSSACWKVLIVEIISFFFLAVFFHVLN